MKLRVAVFNDSEIGLQRICAYDASEFCAQTIRLTEFVEVDFPDLPRETIVQKEVANLDHQANKHRDAILRIEQKKAELLALPAPANLDDEGNDVEEQAAAAEYMRDTTGDR